MKLGYRLFDFSMEFYAYYLSGAQGKTFLTTKIMKYLKYLQFLRNSITYSTTEQQKKLEKTA